MIVVDVNVIAYLLIQGEKTADAQAVRQLDPDWYVPDLWRDEWLNILATYVRQRGIALVTAKELWQTAVDLFAGYEQRADPLTVLDLASRFGISAYDAQYLAVATALGAKLMTEDQALCRAAPQQTITLRDYRETPPHTAPTTPDSR